LLKAGGKLLREAAAISLRTWFSLAVSPPGSSVNTSHLKDSSASVKATAPVVKKTVKKEKTAAPATGKV
jgi:hypothetical protein